MPPEYELYEASNRTIQGRYLLRPGQEANEIIRGILARAQRLYGIQIVAATFLSNHYHLLFLAATVEQTAAFMSYLNGNLARKLGALHGWSGPFWHRRFSIAPVENTEEDQVRRLRYVLAQGCKENLVWSPREWPGVHCAREITTGEPIKGRWLDQTEKYRSKLRGEDRPDSDFQILEECELVPLPCWSHLPAPKYRNRVRDLLGAIEEETRVRHAEEKTEPRGASFVLDRAPQQSPHSVKSSPSPRIHACSERAQVHYREALAWFVSVYREASRRFRAGDLTAEFPPGCFRPRGPCSPLARAPA